jgi:recombination protein RecT
MADANPTEIIKSNLAALQDLLVNAESRIAQVLPAHLKADRMISVTMELVSSDSYLAKCEPLSILQGLLEASQLGLLLTKNLGHGYLVPYRNGQLSKKYKRDVYEAKFMIGYRGFVDLVLRDGQASTVYSRLVFPGEEFRIVEGTKHELHHSPKLEGDVAYKPTGGKTHIMRYGERVEVPEMAPNYLGAYAVVIYAPAASGFPRPPDFEWMPSAEIEKVRKVSRATSEDSPWQTWPEEMLKKTPIRRLCKRLKLSPDSLAAMVRDEYRELGVDDVERQPYELEPEIREPQRKAKEEPAEAATSAVPAQPNGQNGAPKNGVAKLGRQQIGDIIRALNDTKRGADFAAFLKEKYKTDDLNSIPAVEFDAIIRFIKETPQAAPKPPALKISKDQAQALDDIARNTGWQPLEWVGFLAKKFNASSSRDLTVEVYEAALRAAHSGSSAV